LEYLSELAYKEWGAPHRKKSKDGTPARAKLQHSSCQRAHCLVSLGFGSPDIRRLVGQGDIQLTEEAYARTEKVLKDFIAKKKWFLAPDKAATTVGNRSTPSAPHSPARLGQHVIDPAPVTTKSEPTAGTTKTRVEPQGKDGSPQGKERRAGREEDGCSKEDEARNEAVTVNLKEETAAEEEEEVEETDDGFTKAVSRNPWKEAEQEEKRRRAEAEEQQRRESEERRREEEQRRLADEERRLAEARRREEAIVLTGAIRLQALYRGRLARTAFRSKRAFGPSSLPFLLLLPLLVATQSLTSWVTVRQCERRPIERTWPTRSSRRRRTTWLTWASFSIPFSILSRST
jgi:hypothetical protein